MNWDYDYVGFDSSCLCLLFFLRVWFDVLIGGLLGFCAVAKRADDCAVFGEHDKVSVRSGKPDSPQHGLRLTVLCLVCTRWLACGKLRHGADI